MSILPLNGGVHPESLGEFDMHEPSTRLSAGDASSGYSDTPDLPLWHPRAFCSGSPRDISPPNASEEPQKTRTARGIGYFVYWGRPNDAVYARPPVTYVPDSPQTFNGESIRYREPSTSATEDLHCRKCTPHAHDNVDDAIMHPTPKCSSHSSTHAASHHIADAYPIVRLTRNFNRRLCNVARGNTHPTSFSTATYQFDTSDDDVDLGTASFPCEAEGCFQIFKRACNLARHVRAVHSRTRAVCLVCGKSLARRDAVVRHQCTSRRCIEMQNALIDAGAAESIPRSADDVLTALKCIPRGDPRRATFVACDYRWKEEKKQIRKKDKF